MRILTQSALQAYNEKTDALMLVGNNGNSLKNLSEKYRGDKEVVMQAVGNDGLALSYASEELRKDKEVVMKAVIENGSALKFASNELKEDKDLISVVSNHEEKRAKLSAELAQSHRSKAVTPVFVQTKEASKQSAHTRLL